MALERWQNKTHKLRQHLRGWAKHTSRTLRKDKKKFLSLLGSLDKKAEIYKHYLKERLVLLLRKEEIRWYEIAKVKTLLE
jgi:hypothetical protein